MPTGKPPDDDGELEALAEAMMAGERVDWNRTTDDGTGQQELVKQLEAIARIMAANRAAVPSTGGKPTWPREWGPLRIVSRVGTGAWGEVFRAHDPRLDRPVALKLVHPRRVASPGHSENIMVEGRLLARVRHVNVVTVHGAEEHAGQIGIVMEFIEGATIQEVLQEQGPMSPEEALVIGRDVSRALAALHGADILHRDIKSRNVMREVGGRVVLMDLGIGCDRSDSQSSDRLGTPLYAAPETLFDQSATRRADIYAVGVLLFHMVTGTYPVTGQSLDEIAAAHRTRRASRLRDLRPNLPEVFLRIVERALAADPHARPGSAGALARDIVNALGERTGSPVAVRTTLPSIAVLPFRDLSPRHDHEYLCEGLAEQIIHALFQIPGLRVVARTSSFFYKDRQVDVQEIGRHLGVTTLLDGSVRVDGDRIRVAVQLVDVEDVEHIWSAQYECTTGNVLQVEDEISGAIVDHLAGRLVDNGRRAARHQHTADARALHHFLQGRFLFNRGLQGDLEAALQRFQLAVGCDPGYALALAGIAACSSYLYAYRFSNSREHLELAQSASALAVERDPTLAEVQATRGFAHLLYWEWDAAGAALNRAFACNPNNLTAMQYYAHYLMAVGRLDEAREMQERCVEVDPMSRFAHGWLALYRLRSGRVSEARKHLEPLVDLPNCPPLIRIIIGQSHILEERFETGIDELETGRREWDGDPMVLASLGWAYGLAGRRDEAERVIAVLEEDRSRVNIRPFLLVRVHAGLGNREEAYAWLSRSVDERDPYLIGLKSDQTIANLRDDPRYAAILRRINLD